MTGYQDADQVEAAFYAAFADCDVAAMEAVWAEHAVMCVHPGAVPLLSHEAVMRSWEHIFSGAQMPSLQFQVIRKFTGEDLAVHVVEEQIATPGEPGAAAIVLATNVYRHAAEGWLMVSHQGVLMSSTGASGHTLQ